MNKRNLLQFKTRASLSVEAAFVLPIYIFFVTCIICLIQFVKINLVVSEVCYNNAKAIQAMAYPLKTIEESEVFNEFSFSKDIITNAYIYGQIKEELNKSKFSSSLILEDFNLSGSKVLQNNSDILIKVKYKLKPMFSFFGLLKVNCEKEIFAHAYTGYEGKADEDDNPFVYITTHGTVYHKSPSCPYLDLSISTISTSSVDDKRNYNGGKYYPCEKCMRGNGLNAICYITNYGTKFHSDINCSGLKRDVKKVKLSEVGGRGPCSKCS